MNDESELRATSDLMLRMLDRVRDAEVRKRDLSPGTDEFSKLAYEVMELSRMLGRWAELQLRQANEMADGADPSAGPPYPALVDVPARRLDEVLAEWRQAEIRLSQALPSSPEAAAAAADAARLREEYHAIQERKHEERQAH